MYTIQRCLLSSYAARFGSWALSNKRDPLDTRGQGLGCWIDDVELYFCILDSWLSGEHGASILTCSPSASLAAQ